VNGVIGYDNAWNAWKCLEMLGIAWEKLETGQFSRDRKMKIYNLLPKQGKFIKIN